jgi:formylglycine-generating enzyme required for sulfatase activity
MDNDKVRLYEFILDQYSLSELKDLCFYLDVTFDDLEGGARKDKARELVEYMTRRKRLDDLRAVLNQQRPDDYRAAFPIATALLVSAPVASTTRRNPRQIFISHATADSEFAHRLAADLRRDGYAIWIAPESIHPGEQWVRAINRGLEESGVMVLVLTPAAAASPWVEMETNVAIELERSKEAAFIPLLRERGRYPGLWRAYQWVMMDGEYAAGLAALRERLSVAVDSDDHVEWLKSLPDKVFPGTVSHVPRSNPDRRIHEKTGIELIRIPAGPFLYGDDKRKIELPEYWIGRAPVTNAQYKRFLDANPDHPVPFFDNDWAKPYNWDAKRRMYSPDKAEHPVVLVNWHDAKAFCDWAGLALPSEEQWEKAARGTDGRKWPWSDEPPTKNHCNFGKNVGSTTAVGNYSPQGDSPYGCADMAGNVWEWAESLYPEGEPWRVLRGGSWWAEGEGCRCALRNWYDPLSWNVDGGFRVLVAPS